MITTRLRTASRRLRNGDVDEPSLFLDNPPAYPRSSVLHRSARFGKKGSLASVLRRSHCIYFQNEPAAALYGPAFGTSHVLGSALCLTTGYVWRRTALSIPAAAGSPAGSGSLCPCAYVLRNLRLPEWSDIAPVGVAA
jgi:hypothetical protein